MNENRPYEGAELELFAKARNWKKYWSDKIRRHLGKTVLEVGAGLGVNTRCLIGPQQERWVCLEPDGKMAEQIPATLADLPQRNIVETRAGTLRHVPTEELFDTILYIDVLEHIADDQDEMRRALAHLSLGGKIVVLSPAHPMLYTDFDRELGHFRRYTRKSLRACAPDGAKLIDLFALDSFGLLASVANKLFLHQSMPTEKQIAFWDGTLVPISRVIDPVIGFALGKSLIAVWQKQ
jgi:SAM-dependent methyltransferase